MKTILLIILAVAALSAALSAAVAWAAGALSRWVFTPHPAGGDHDAHR